MPVRRYDMVHDGNAVTGTYQWKMARTDEGQYIPFIDHEAEVERLKETDQAFAIAKATVIIRAQRDVLAQQVEQLTAANEKLTTAFYGSYELGKEATAHWIKCSDRLPPFKHTNPAGGISSSRQHSDKVLALWHDKEFGWQACEAVCGIKTEDDWGKVPENTPFWCDDHDLLGIHGRPDAPTYWMPLPEKP